MALAQTPPMGWNSWNVGLDANDYPDFNNLTEKSILAQAKAMVDSGLLAAGYEYFVLDDGYQNARRDYRGRLQGHALRFRAGIPALVDEVKALGLKFGIYSVPGSLTCAQQYNDYVADGLGSLGKEQIDAEAFAEWGIDFLKYDWCRAHLNDGLLAKETFAKMAKALDETGREIVYSISEYGLFKPHEWAPEFTQMWRTTDDLFANWQSILRTIDLQVDLYPYSKPGTWNDPDMLQIGNHGLNPAENRSHLYVWAILNAPLMIGTDLVNMTDEVRDLLTNTNVIEIDQDWGGQQGRKVWSGQDAEIWAKPMSDGSLAAVLLNRGDTTATFAVNAQTIGREFTSGLDVPSGQDLGISGSASFQIGARDSMLIRVR